MCRGNSVGPDWTDIAGLISCIELVHSVSVVLTATIAGVGGTGGLYLQAYAVPVGQLPFEGERAGLVLKSWPNPDHKFVESCFLSALYELDYLISKELYSQQKLPF